MRALVFPRWLPGRLLLPVGALLLACVILASALLAREDLANQARAERAQEVGLVHALGAGAQGAAPACAVEVAYVQALPLSVALDPLAQSLHDSAKAFGVSVKSISGEPRPQTARTLASLDVSIAMHGAYPGVKAALAEGLARFPSGAITRLHIKQDGLSQPPIEDATVQVTFALQPPPSETRDCRVATSAPGAKESP